jgi:hypothetical protein
LSRQDELVDCPSSSLCWFRHLLEGSSVGEFAVAVAVVIVKFLT